MSNLSDLLPAGAAAKQLTFTDSGSGISSKAPVVLNSNGTVSEISGQTFAIGTPASMSATLTTWYIGVTYHTAEDKIVVLWIEDTTRNLYLQAGTVSGTSITWGSSTLVDNGIASNQIADICYDSNANCLNYSWVSSAFAIRNECATLSGTTFTRDNSNTITVSSSGITRLRQIFDPTNNKVALALVISATTYGEFYSISISGTTPTASTDIMWSGFNGVDIMDMVHDPDEQRVIIGFTGTGSAQGGVVLVDQSSSTPTASSITQYQATDAYATQVAYDTTNDKLVIGYYDNANSGYTSFIAGTVNASGGTVSFGTKTTTSSALYRYPNDGDLIFDPANNILLYSYVNGDTTSPSDYGNYLLNLSLSGTTVSIDGQNVLDGATGSTDYWANGRLVFDPDNNKPFYIYRDVGNSNYGKGIVITPGFSNVANFVGVADSAISASAAGSVIVQGGTVSGITDPFGTVTSSYGTPTTAISAYQSESKVLAYDSANNRLVMAYKDGGNSDYGTAVVGELSGTSITWGTPVVFESATTGSAAMDIAFDSNVNRIVIAYQDQGNSSYGTAIVGSVSGTGSGSTIAFGSPTIFESADTRYLGMTFDSNDNRIVIVYSDAGNSFYATYVIGTVTTGPDAISFNTPALLNGSARTYETSVSFDATENKVLVAYSDDSYDLYVLNLAISGGSGTPGTDSSFGVGSPQQRFPRCVYDSVNGKSGVAYAEGTNLPIYFSVISMSGSNVTIETRVLAGDTSDSNYFMHNIAFDASSGQLVICTRDASASKGIAYYGSISGTTSSWTTSGSLFADETILTYGVDVAYDTSANKLAFVYSPSSGSNSEAVVGTLGTTTLTIGTDYYVQTDGTLSTDTGGQLIGNAIKTNQINIKDYTG